MKLHLATILICMTGPAAALAQSNDYAARAEQAQSYAQRNAQSPESERQRLGNERIQVDTQLRAREEQRRLEEAAQRSLGTGEEARQGNAAGATMGPVVKMPDAAARAMMSPRTEPPREPAAAPSPTDGAPPSQSVESERQRLGNERIHLDMQARAREEQQRLDEAAQQSAQQSAQPEEPAREGGVASFPLSKITEYGARRKSDMSRTLEQLRTLGELRDAGYITDQEFKRIKQRILDGRT